MQHDHFALQHGQVVQRAADIDGLSGIHGRRLRKHGRLVSHRAHADDGPSLPVQPGGLQHAMQVTDRRSDAQQFSPCGRELHKHRLHQVLRLRPAARQRTRVAKQRRRMPIVQLPKRVLTARDDLAESCRSCLSSRV